MSEQDKCPKCGAVLTETAYSRKLYNMAYLYSCGSDHAIDGKREFWQSDTCRIGELEQRLAAVDAERDELLGGLKPDDVSYLLERFKLSTPEMQDKIVTAYIVSNAKLEAERCEWLRMSTEMAGRVIAAEAERDRWKQQAQKGK